MSPSAGPPGWGAAGPARHSGVVAKLRTGYRRTERNCGRCRWPSARRGFRTHPDSADLPLVRALPEHGEALFAQAREMDLEAIVGKRP